jgi:hypothetical protein
MRSDKLHTLGDAPTGRGGATLRMRRPVKDDDPRVGGSTLVWASTNRKPAAMTHPERTLGAMTVVEDAARVAQAGSWILAGTTHGSTQVRSLVPDSFEDYARIFHPAARQADECDVPVRALCEPANGVPFYAKAYDGLWREVRWREIAEANGKIAHPAIQWPSITACHDAALGTQPGLWERVPQRDSLPPHLTGVLCGRVCDLEPRRLLQQACP